MPTSSPTATRKPKRPVTYDHLKAKKPIERVVQVCLDPDAATALQEAAAELDRLRLAGSDTSAAELAHEKARAEAEESTVTCRFRQIGRKAYDALVASHPPSDKNTEERKDAPYNPETFSIALVAASCIEPAMTEEEVAELAETWNLAEFMPLWVAALEVNTQRRAVDLGKGWSATRS